MAQDLKVAKKYARALLSACNPNRLEAVRDALKTLVGTLESNPDLNAVFSDPRVSEGELIAVTKELGKLISQPEDVEVVSNFLAVLVTNKRLTQLPIISVTFTKLIEELRKELSLEVTSAFPLDSAEREDLTKAVKAEYGNMVTIEWHVDADLIGGLRVQAGDRQLDSTIRGALEKMRHELFVS